MLKTSNDGGLDRARAPHKNTKFPPARSSESPSGLRPSGRRILRRGRQVSLTKLASQRCLGLGLRLLLGPALTRKFSISELSVQGFRQTHCHHQKMHEIFVGAPTTHQGRTTSWNRCWCCIRVSLSVRGAQRRGLAHFECCGTLGFPILLSRAPSCVRDSQHQHLVSDFSLSSPPLEGKEETWMEEERTRRKIEDGRENRGSNISRDKSPSSERSKTQPLRRLTREQNEHFCLGRKIGKTNIREGTTYVLNSCSGERVAAATRQISLCELLFTPLCDYSSNRKNPQAMLSQFLFAPRMKI